MISSLGGCKGLLGLNHGLDTIVHVLNEIFLRAAETSLVGDIVNSVSALRVLTVATADLDVVFISNSLELIHLRAEKWQRRSWHARPKIVHQARAMAEEGSGSGRGCVRG